MPTCSVHGLRDERPFSEDDPVDSQYLYARSKQEGEEVLQRSDDGVRVVVMRFATLYGPSLRMRFDLVVNLMTQWPV